MGNMKPSKSSLDRLPKDLHARWEPDRRHFEEALREGDVIPAAAVSVAMSLDGVLVPMTDGAGTAKRDGRVAYLRSLPRGDTRARDSSRPGPVHFLARIAALVPPPRYPRTRLAGVLAPRSTSRAAVVKYGRDETQAPPTPKTTASLDARGSLERVLSPDVALQHDRNVSCGTVLWRFRDRLQLTVVVKALFAIVSDGVATAAGPAPVLARDRHRDGNPARSIEAASDLAPYLPRCDVLFVGRAHAPGGRTASSARIGIARDRGPLLDKTVHVFGDRGPAGPVPFTEMPLIYERARGGIGQPNPIGTATPNLVDPRDANRAAGFAPIPRFWEERKRLLGSIDSKAIHAPIAEIPEAMPWAYFQTAPLDQQIDYLHGDEWLVLDGLHPTLPRVQTRLASVRGAARISAAHAPVSAPLETAVELVCDTLAIDGDRQTFSLTWRGRVDIADRSAITVAAAIEAPGVPVDWARVRGETPLAVARAPQASSVPLNLHATAGPTEVPKGPELPFQRNASAAAVLARLPASSPPARAQRSYGTAAISLSDLPPLEQPHMPFARFPAVGVEPGAPAAPAAPLAPSPEPSPAPSAAPAVDPSGEPSVAVTPWRQPDPEPAAPPAPAAAPPSAGPPPVSAQVKRGVYGRFGR
jgi:hypothetical protein